MQFLMDAIRAGTLQTDEITLREFLQVSMMAILYDNWGIDMEEFINDQGCVYVVHACVNRVKPPTGDISPLRRMQ